MRTLRIIKCFSQRTMEFTWLLSFLAIVSPISIAATMYSSSASKFTNAVATLNSSCFRPSDCVNDRFPTYLHCVKGRCTCESHTFYDEYEGMCRIRSPSQCVIKRSQSEVVQPCVRYASCSYPVDHHGNELKSSAQGTCMCQINKSKNPDGTCSGSHPAAMIPASRPLITIGVLCSLFTTIVQMIR